MPVGISSKLIYYIRSGYKVAYRFAQQSVYSSPNALQSASSYIANKNDFIYKKNGQRISQPSINDNTDFNGGVFNKDPALYANAFKANFTAMI
jgi:hypothetical protein